MKLLVQYETDDGKLFDDINDACLHENSLQLGSVLFRQLRMSLSLNEFTTIAHVALQNIYVDSAGNIKILEGDVANEG